MAAIAGGSDRDDLAGNPRAALGKEPSDDPLVRLRAVGSGYLRWAVRNPTHFQVISDRKLIDFDGSASLRRDNDELQALMASL